eukprot:913535-Pelagomonas_calceolata.AAC.1
MSTGTALLVPPCQTPKKRKGLTSLKIAKCTMWNGIMILNGKLLICYKCIQIWMLKCKPSRRKDRNKQ